MPSVTQPVSPGDTIARKYRVERVLGQGGMGVVVLATHLQLKQRVAIKFLLREVASSAEAVARFEREARAAVRIQSEHVARVMDVGELDDGAPYMVMEYLEGRDLAAIIGETGTISVGAAVDFVLQACEAIAEAHSVGIIHRDLKPANLFVTQRADGSTLVKVLDFGISKSAPTGDPSEQSLTKTTAFVGSPMYVPPEQLVSSRSVDARSDIWSIGVVLYEALAGEPPFIGESVMEVASRILQHAPRELCVANPSIPAALSDVVGRCLSKSPDLRFADVGALARALAPFAPQAAISVDRISRMFSNNPPPPPQFAAVPHVAPVDATLMVAGREALRPAGRTQRAWGSETDDPPSLSSIPRSSTAPKVVLLLVVAAAIGAGSFWAFGYRQLVAQTPASTPAVGASSPSLPSPLVSPPPTLPTLETPPSATAVASTLPVASAATAARPYQTARPAIIATSQVSTASAAPAPSPTLAKKNPLTVEVK